MTNDVQLSIVIPAYQEAENLRLLLPRLVNTLTGLNITHEILVVDTNPPKDETPLVCQAWPVRHILRQGGECYGDAVRTGIAMASGEKILFMDADGSHSPEFIPSMWQYAREYDVVIASRYAHGGDTENPWCLIVMSRMLNIVYAVVLGLKCRDVSNSFKLYGGDILRSLQLRCRHFDIVEELLVMASAKSPKLSILEIPYIFKKRLLGETKRNLVVFMISFLATLAKLFWRRITA